MGLLQGQLAQTRRKARCRTAFRRQDIEGVQALNQVDHGTKVGLRGPVDPPHSDQARSAIRLQGHGLGTHRPVGAVEGVESGKGVGEPTPEPQSRRGAQRGGKIREQPQAGATLNPDRPSVMQPIEQRVGEPQVTALRSMVGGTLPQRDELSVGGARFQGRASIGEPVSSVHR